MEYSGVFPFQTKLAGNDHDKIEVQIDLFRNVNVYKTNRQITVQFLHAICLVLLTMSKFICPVLL